MPQKDAGTRTEPPPSLPMASVTEPLAAAAAEPQLDPPVVSAGFLGFRVTPCSGPLLEAFQPNSVVVVRPISTAPAASARSTTRRGDCRAGVGVEPGTAGVDLSADVDQVLDRDRHAMQRPQRLASRALGIPLGCGSSCFFVIQHGIGVDHGLRRMRSLQTVVDCVARGQHTGSQGAGKPCEDSKGAFRFDKMVLGRGWQCLCKGRAKYPQNPQTHHRQEIFNCRSSNAPHRRAWRSQAKD